jgi:hypothetical protein
MPRYHGPDTTFKEDTMKIAITYCGE